MPTRRVPAFLADTPIIDGSLSGVSSMPFLDELIHGGFHAANWTVAGGYGDGTLSSLARIAERYALMEQHPDTLLLVERPADIEQAKREGKLGVRIVGLTYNNRMRYPAICGGMEQRSRAVGVSVRSHGNDQRTATGGQKREGEPW